MPQIVISDELAAKLKRIGGELLSTTETLERLLKWYENERINTTQQKKLVEKLRHSAKPSKPVYTDINTPDLTHTKLITATIDGENLENAKWASLVRHMHVLAFQMLDGDPSAVNKISTANTVVGIKIDEGYKPLVEAGISIQGVDANNAWQITAKLARKLGIHVRLRIAWRNRSDAERPGEECELTCGKIQSEIQD